MVTLRIPTQNRKIARRTNPVRTAIRNCEATLSDLPVMSRFTNKRPLMYRMTRPLAQLSKTQRIIALSVAVGTTFIALDALIVGIVIGYTRHHQTRQEKQAATMPGSAEQGPDEILVETVVEEFAHADDSIVVGRCEGIALGALSDTITITSHRACGYPCPLALAPEGIVVLLPWHPIHPFPSSHPLTYRGEM